MRPAPRRGNGGKRPPGERLVRPLQWPGRMTEHDGGTAFPGGETQSIWQGTFPVPDYPALDWDLTTDVCVVGAGIAGLSAAYMLAREGKQVAVLDDGPIGGGETGRTTAHLSDAMDDRIYVLESVHGQEGARRIVSSHGAAINRIEEIVRLEGIDCDFARLPGYLFLAPGDGEDILDRELHAAHRTGLADVHKLSRAPVAEWDSGPCLEFPNQARFHALKYLTGLAQAFVRMGGRIHCGTHVASVEGGSPCKVKTQDGRTVTAGAVCVCTNASITDMVRTHTLQAPYRTFAVALGVPRGSVNDALYWDTGTSYHYARLQPLDPASAGVTKGETLYDALIVGGEDHRTGNPDHADERWDALVSWTRERWPQARELLFAWSGQCLEPNDYAAFIGANPDGAANVYMASGDSGQGMTHGTIAGILLTDLIQGRDNPWATVYDPRRVTLGVKPAEDFLMHNADVAYRFVKDYLLTGDVATPENIQPGQGRVIRRGVHKIAAYRDESGTLHECSAVCTHLKCVVAWNATEKSWDCPCHGSRFDPYGKVLNGPAVDDLPPAE